MERGQMVVIECPWCDAEVGLESTDVVDCEDCGIRVEVAPDGVAEVALAA
jgi:hypothetical protein